MSLCGKEPMQLLTFLKGLSFRASIYPRIKVTPGFAGLLLLHSNRRGDRETVSAVNTVNLPVKPRAAD